MWTKSQVWIFEKKYRIIIFSCFSEIKSSWNYTVLYIYHIYIKKINQLFTSEDTLENFDF